MSFFGKKGEKQYYKNRARGGGACNKKGVNMSDKNKSKTVKNKRQNSGMSKKEKELLLTPNQESFVFYLLEGYTRRRAYKMAYPNCKAEDRVVDVKAYELFHSDKVRVRYEEGRKEIANRRLEEAVIKGQKANEELERIAYGEIKIIEIDKDGNKLEKEMPYSLRLAALKELRKDYGEIVKIQAMENSALSESELNVNIKVLEE